MALSVLFVSQVLVGASSAQKIRAGEGALGEERGESLRDTPALLGRSQQVGDALTLSVGSWVEEPVTFKLLLLI